MFTIDDSSGEQIWESDLYPKRAVHDLQVKRFAGLDRRLNSIYREVVACYNSGLLVLCAVGLRALMEGICADKGVKERRLQQSIESLRGLLPGNIVDSLHGFRFMGNEAAHELQAPAPDDLHLAIEVMEDLLNFLYSLEYKASRLRRS